MKALSWKFIFLGWRDITSPVDAFCPECKAVLKIGVKIEDDKLAVYYAHCYRCGFDLKIKRELDEDGFNLENFLETL